MAKLATKSDQGTGRENVADVITRHASERPYAVALIERDSVLHYRTLEAAVWAASAYFRRSGIAPGDVVGVALPHSTLYLVAIYALARIGAISTALPLSDPPALRENAARRFAIKWVVAQTADAGPGDVATVVVTPESLRGIPGTPVPGLRVDGGERPWIIRRTSGTTGEVKGVARTHRASFANYVGTGAYFPGTGHRLLAVLDLSTTYSLKFCERTLFGGGTIVVASAEIGSQGFLDLIDRHAITHIALTPNFFSSLLRHLPTDACRCPTLLDVTAAGMAMPESLRSEIRRRLSPNLSIKYASNEAQYLTCADAAMQEKFPETVGAILPGVELEIVDDEDRKLPAGEAGHIRARTPWMPTGYVNTAQEVERRTFRNGWIYIGDIGVLNEDGMLFIKGRADDMINFDGVKIMPADIEAALLSHPAVVDAAAFPIASPRHHHLPAAAVILRHPAGGDELMAHCRRLQGMRAPQLICVEESFPRNAMGKVLKTELAQRLLRKLKTPPP